MLMNTKSYLFNPGSAFLLLLSLTSCGGSSDRKAPPVSSVAPTVQFKSTLDDPAFISPDGKVIASFSQEMEASSLNNQTFLLTSGSSAVPIEGLVTYLNSTAVFLPTAPLPEDDSFTATITTGARNLAGITLPTNQSRRFSARDFNSRYPHVLTTSPLDNASNVSLNTSVSATFTMNMDPTTLHTGSFTLAAGAEALPVQGTVNYADATAVFLPEMPLAGLTMFTATIKKEAKGALGEPLAKNHSWSFTTGDSARIGVPVNLGTAGNFVILAKSGISTVPASAITGNIGVSPAAATYITGFSLIADATNVFSTCPQVVGKVYAANYAAPTPSNMTTAVGDMETAFTDASGRAPDFTELGGGNIGGMTLSAGVYKWGTAVLIPFNLTLTGSATDIWIFEIAQTLTVSNGAKVFLAGGALPKNIFWQVAGKVDVGTTAHLEGVVLTKTSIAMRTGASINGRLLAQTAVTLDSNTVVEPAP